MSTMTTLVKVDNRMPPASAIVVPNSGLQSSSDGQHARSTASITTGEQPAKAVPPKCAFVPGLIQSSMYSSRVKYQPPSSYPPITSSMTARKPLCSSPLAGPPALFDTGSDSESDETENPSGPVSPINSDPPSPSWNIPPALSPYSNFDLKPRASPRGPRVRVRVPCPPPKCYLHPRNTAINNADNDPFTIHDLTRAEPDTLLTRYKCTCNENDSNGKKNVLKKKRSSTSSPTSPTPNSSAPRALMPLSSPAPSSDQKKSTLAGVNEVEKDATRSRPRPDMRSIEDIASEREIKKSLPKRRELEAGLEGFRRGTINVADGLSRDRVNPAGGGAGSGVGVPIFRVVDDEEDDGADGMGGVKESAGELRRSIRPGELGHRGMDPGTLEGARRSEGRVLGGGRPVSLHVVAEGESRRRKDEWETDFASSLNSVRRHDGSRRMTMMELGMVNIGGSNRKRNVIEGPRVMSTLNEWEEFGLLKPPSQHLLSPLSAVSGEGKESNLDAVRRRSMAHPFTSRTTRVGSLSSSTSSVPSNLFNPPITPPSKRFSMSTSSPLSSPSHSPHSLSFSVSGTTSRSSSSPTPRSKLTTAAGNSWYMANPWGEIPKFTRLGLSAPGVVLPISAKEYVRLKRGHTTSPANRRWSNFRSSNSSSCSSFAHVSVSSSQENDPKGTEAEVEPSKTLSRSSSASATTSASSSTACWSACTTSTTTSPSPTSEENESMQRVLSMESVESVDDVALKSDPMAFETVKQTNHANKSHRSLGIIKGLRGNSGAGHPRSTGPIHPYASSELTLAMGNVRNAGVEAASSSRSLVPCKFMSPMGVDHTLSTPSLGQYPSSYSLSTSGQIGMGEGGKLRRGDSSVKRWWKSLVGGAR